MKLLFLCKRRPQGKDLIKRPYGRFHYLPKALAHRGHDTRVLLLSHKNDPKLSIENSKIQITSTSLLQQGPLTYLHDAKKIIKKTHPDWIIGFSDTYYGIIAQHIAQQVGCKSMIDAYDNYESYLPWCKPLHYLWRRALSQADLVTAAGPQLAELMAKTRAGKPTLVLPMAADPTGFKPLDKIQCRKELGLPSHKKMIGYCGAIHSNRGIDLLFDAYKILRQKHKNIELVLSGRKGPGVSIPDGVRWLGYLPDGKIPTLLNSMDVLTVINRISAFGNYSYPVKLYEAMCCQVPVVATATSSTEWILDGFPDFLAAPNDSNDLSKKIMIAMQHDKIEYGHREGWEDEANTLEKHLMDLSRS